MVSLSALGILMSVYAHKPRQAILRTYAVATAYLAASGASEFLFVTGYPMTKRPFYTHPDPARPEYSASFDLLFRGTELVTGGQRLHRHADYVAALAARGMNPAPFAEYLEVFRNGMPPHVLAPQWERSR